jgi:hypothetical protein
MIMRIPFSTYSSVAIMHALPPSSGVSVLDHSGSWGS